MKKRIVMLLVLALPLLAAVPAAHAQSSFGVAWSLGLPLGDTDEFAPGLSARGVSLDYRRFRSRSFAVGASAGWNVFSEAWDGTYANDDIALTAKRWDSINAVPIYVSAFHYFGQDRRSQRWYAGLNAGTVYLERTVEIASYIFEDKTWHAALAPEVGVQLPWDAFAGYLALRYNVAFEAGGVPTQSWLDLRVGFGLD